MLEIRNLSKTYKPKKGVPVTALNSVSLAFPEKGMVFLLGKSGCGKSGNRRKPGNRRVQKSRRYTGTYRYRYCRRADG